MGEREPVPGAIALAILVTAVLVVTGTLSWLSVGAIVLVILWLAVRRQRRDKR